MIRKEVEKPSENLPDWAQNIKSAFETYVYMLEEVEKQKVSIESEPDRKQRVEEIAEDFGARAKKRVEQVIFAIKEHYFLATFPKMIEVSSHVPDTDYKRIYLLPRTQELVIAPIIPKRNPIFPWKVTLVPDFSKREEAPVSEWLGTRRAVDELLNKTIPEQYRAQIHEGTKIQRIP